MPILAACCHILLCVLSLFHYSFSIRSLVPLLFTPPSPLIPIYIPLTFSYGEFFNQNLFSSFSIINITFYFHTMKSWMEYSIRKVITVVRTLSCPQSGTCSDDTLAVAKI